MGSYYYLLAQLPYLIYGQKPPMTSNSFRDMAHSFLSKKDSSLLDSLSLNPDKLVPENSKKKTEKCQFIDVWYEWERDLRSYLGKYRAQKLKRDDADLAGVLAASTKKQTIFPLLLPPVMPMETFSLAAMAVTHEGTPLEVEIMLDKARWTTIELLTGTNYFHRNNVFAYYLKLLLMERRQLFNKETGFSNYKTLYTEILESPHALVENSGHISTGEHT